jgi:nucleotide-binding universal stress UspA family protein
MYETVIWATDGSDRADVALHEARRLVEPSGGRLVAVHCDRRLSGRAGSWPAQANEDDVRIKIRRQAEELRRDGVDVVVVVRPSYRDAADVIASVAVELDADVIVCGTRGHGALTGAFVHSFAHRMLHVAPCPVLAVPEGAAVARAQPVMAG